MTMMTTMICEVSLVPLHTASIFHSTPIASPLLPCPVRRAVFFVVVSFRWSRLVVVVGPLPACHMPCVPASVDCAPHRPTVGHWEQTQGEHTGTLEGGGETHNTHTHIHNENMHSDEHSQLYSNDNMT